MRAAYLSLLFSLFFSGLVHGQGYRIQVQLENFDQSELFLGYHYGDKQYLRDTALLDESGQFVFEGEEALEEGLYLIVLPPDNKFFQLLINKEEQDIKLVTNALSPAANIKIEGSKDNQLFYEYLNFLSAQRPVAEGLAKEIQGLGEDKATEKAKLEEKLKAINEKVAQYQRDFVADHPDLLSAAIIKANIPLEIPEYEGAEEDVQFKKWRYMIDHYFDPINMTDPRMLRTPFLFQRIDEYVNQINVQHPDSIKIAIDKVLTLLEPTEESFKYYLIHYLNSFAKSKIVGMDAVYVHMVDKYYATGKAPWTEEEQLKKIIDDANAIKPLLIGKIAPDIEMEQRDGEKIKLHDVDAEFTILYFWRYDCGHCKKSTPFMKEYYDKVLAEGKDIKLFSVCTKFYTKDEDETKKCWEYIDENEIGNWLHTTDKFHRSKFAKIYNVKTTPQMYVLDRNKEIISKQIGAEQLDEVMDQIIEMHRKENGLNK